MSFEFKNQAVETPDQKREKLAPKAKNSVLKAVFENPVKSTLIALAVFGIGKGVLNSGKDVIPNIDAEVNPAKSMTIDNLEQEANKKEHADKLKDAMDINQAQPQVDLGDALTLKNSDKKNDITVNETPE